MVGVGTLKLLHCWLKLQAVQQIVEIQLILASSVSNTQKPSENDSI